MTARRERNSERSRQDILQAAERQFAEKGFYGARVDEIAAAAAINKRMIYEYFGSKELLYKQVLFQVYRRLETAERNLIEHQLSGITLIRSLISMYFDFLRDNDTFVSILMWENLNRGQCLREMPEDSFQRPTLHFFMKEIQRGKEEGIFREDLDTEQLVVSLITVCFANFSNRYTLSELFGLPLDQPTMMEKRKAHTIDLILTYICPEGRNYRKEHFE